MGRKRSNMIYEPIDKSNEKDFFDNKLPRLFKQRAELSLYFANLLVDEDFEDLDLQIFDALRLTAVVLGEFVDIGKKIRSDKNNLL